MVLGRKNKWFMFRAILILLGLGILAYWVTQLGPRTIFKTILDLKAWSLLIILNFIIGFLLQTVAWRTCYSPKGDRVSFIKLFRIKLCGEAVNLMTPLNFAVGDPVRAHLVSKTFGLEGKKSSVIVDRFIHAMASISFVLIGLLVTAGQSLPIETHVRWLVIINSLELFILIGLKGFFRIQF